MKAIESKLFLISQPLLQGLASYLSSRPYREVFEIMDRLKTLQEAEEVAEVPAAPAPVAPAPKPGPTPPTEVPVEEDLT